MLDFNSQIPDTGETIMTKNIPIQHQINTSETMNMKACYAILIVFSFFLNSCRTKEIHELTLNFSNQSINILTIQVFPKKPYIIDPYYNFYNLYFDDTTRTGGPDTKFNTDPGEISRAILVTEHIDAEPTELISKMFDSIYCTIGDKNQAVIKFYPDSVNNYPYNCFKDQNVWITDSVNFPAPCDMHCPNEHYYITRFNFPIIDSLIFDIDS